jgi:hypothetical protein
MGIRIVSLPPCFRSSLEGRSDVLEVWLKNKKLRKIFGWKGKLLIFATRLKKERSS